MKLSLWNYGNKWKGPCINSKEWLDIHAWKVDLEIIKNCKFYIKPNPATNKWYAFLFPRGNAYTIKRIDGEWVKEQSESEQINGF